MLAFTETSSKGDLDSRSLVCFAFGGTSEVVVGSYTSCSFEVLSLMLSLVYLKFEFFDSSVAAEPGEYLFLSAFDLLVVMLGYEWLSPWNYFPSIT